MAYANGTASFGSTGVTGTITTGFLPVYVRLTVGQKFGITDTDSHMSIGSGTPTRYHVDAFFNDTVSALTYDSANYVVYQMEWNGTGIAPVLRGTIDSFSATGFKLNLSLATANYQIYWEAFS